MTLNTGGCLASSGKDPFSGHGHDKIFEVLCACVLPCHGHDKIFEVICACVLPCHCLHRHCTVMILSKARQPSP